MNYSSTLAGRFSFLLFMLGMVIPPAVWGGFTHIVRPGESLSSIAKKYHLSASRLQEANDLENAKLQIGQPLSIPQKTSQAEKLQARGKAKNTEPEQEGEDAETHVVKKGESLRQIARRYRLSVAELREINALKGDHLKVGQILDLTGQEEIAEEAQAENRNEEGEKPDARVNTSSKDGAFTEERDQRLLVRVAKSFLGAKYKRGGTGINGLDCSALVQKVFRIFEIDLPRTAREQSQVGFEVARNTLQRGDLVFFKRAKARQPTHVGIYIGNNQFVHASVRKHRVEVESLETRYFSARFIGGKRIFKLPEPFSMKEPDRS